MDDTSLVFRQLLKIFGGTHPVRVSTGVCCGFFVKILWAVGLAYVPDSPLFKTLNDFSVTYYCIAMAGLFMLPVAFGKGDAPEEVVHQVRTIEVLINAARLGKEQTQMIWRSLVYKYLEAAKPSLNRPVNFNLTEEAKKELAEHATDSTGTG